MCQQFKVTGRVQGVFFREGTRQLAACLNLHGHAINLPDGSVEVVACGSHDAIESLAGWLQKGPRMATVSTVDRIAVTCLRPNEFTTG